MKHSHELNLRAGEWVEVRSKDEILATLDGEGMLDQMPFMPEMLKYCGQRLQVSKRAHKTCDPAVGIGGRGMSNTVHLGNLRCDGADHDGCQAGCLIFWKEAWLKRPDTEGREQDNSAAHPTATRPSQATEETLYAKLKVMPTGGETEPTYMCQNTQVKHATHHLSSWDMRQYVEDFTSGNESLSQLAAGFFYTAWRTVAQAGIGLHTPMRWVYDKFMLGVGGARYPIGLFGVPVGTRTPKFEIGLQEGEMVRVKPFNEILETLDVNYRNRGLYFDVEMVPFTEKQYRVARRVNNIIDEKSCKMIRFKTDAIILENVVCTGRYSYCRRFCPRAIYPYWREIWLERVSNNEREEG